MDLPDPLIPISPDYLSGAPVFNVTRGTQSPCWSWRGGLPSPRRLKQQPSNIEGFACAFSSCTRADQPYSLRPSRPAKSWMYCQATRPERAPRVIDHSSASRARSASGSFSLW
jgi:hypothetical protein